MHDNGRERKLAFLLRHDKNYDLTPNGWREVSDLIKNHGYSMEELTTIVAESGKQRFEFSDDGIFIRARQGHSIAVDVELTETVPPEFLFHGTTSSRIPSIMEQGLLPMSRQYVHLSVDEATATQVGSRHKGDVVVLKIQTRQMWDDGHRFWLSRNNVWLTSTVPSKYITRLSS